MCREILNTCIRNTEEAEKLSAKAVEGGPSGRGMGKGVWGMIEESELARSIRIGEEKKVSDTNIRLQSLFKQFSIVLQNESDIVVRAFACVSELSNALGSGSPATPKIDAPQLSAVLPKAKSVAAELARIIQETEDPTRLEELLEINDQLLGILKKAPGNPKPSLRLQGLGLSFSDSNSSEDGDGRLDGLPPLHGREGEHGHDSSETSSAVDFDEEPPTPTTPKIDKGKGKAEPEPEIPEPVLSPIPSRMGDGDGDDDDEEYVVSPTNRCVN